MTLAGVDSLVHRGKTRSSSVVVRGFCSLPVGAHCCRTVLDQLIGSWFLTVSWLQYTPAMLPVFLRYFANALMLALFCLNETSGVRDNGKRVVERQREKETINGGSQMDFTDEIL